MSKKTIVTISRLYRVQTNAIALYLGIPNLANFTDYEWILLPKLANFTDY